MHFGGCPTNFPSSSHAPSHVPSLIPSLSYLPTLTPSSSHAPSHVPSDTLKLLTSSAPSLPPSSLVFPTNDPSNIHSSRPTYFPSKTPSENFSFKPSSSIFPSSLPSICVGQVVSIAIKTDLYPSETSWKLTDKNDNIVVDGGPYSSKEKVYDSERCLSDGTYTFTINDGHDDGICCTFGHGYYEVKVGGKLIGEGGFFKGKEVKTFTIIMPSSSPSLVPSLSSQPTVMPSEHPSLLPFISSYVVLTLYLLCLLFLIFLFNLLMCL